MSVFWVAREKRIVMGAEGRRYGVYVISGARYLLRRYTRPKGEILWDGDNVYTPEEFERMTGIHLQPGEGPIPFATPEPKRVDFPELEGLDERGNKV